MGGIFLEEKSSGPLRGAGGESSLKTLDWPLGTGLSPEPLSQPPPPPIHWGARMTPTPHPRKPIFHVPIVQAKEEVWVHALGAGVRHSLRTINFQMDRGWRDV